MAQSRSGRRRRKINKHLERVNISLDKGIRKPLYDLPEEEKAIKQKKGREETFRYIKTEIIRNVYSSRYAKDSKGEDWFVRTVKKSCKVKGKVVVYNQLQMVQTINKRVTLDDYELHVERQGKASKAKSTNSKKQSNKTAKRKTTKIASHETNN